MSCIGANHGSQQYGTPMLSFVLLLFKSLLLDSALQGICHKLFIHSNVLWFTGSM